MGKRIEDKDLPLCKYCKTKQVTRGSRDNIMCRCASDACAAAAIYAKHNVYTGKTRPEHGTKIAKALTNKPKSAAHKKNLKTNTDHYKKKMLENKNISYTEDNFLELWHTLVSDIRKGKGYKVTCISNWFSLDRKHVENLSDEELALLYVEFNSQKSLKAMQSNPSMGNGKRETLVDLKFCKNNKEITTRSTFETNFIQDYLEKYEIEYLYEYCYIDNYLPDFIIEMNGEKYIVEIKGTLYEDKRDKFISDFLNVIKQGYKFIAINTMYYKIWKKYDFLNHEIKNIDELHQFMNSCNNYDRSKNDD